jgi:hypothetical protein
MKISQKRQQIETLPEGAWQTVLDFARRALGSGCLFRPFLAPYPPKSWRFSCSLKKKGYRLMWTGKIQATIQPDIFDVSQIPRDWIQFGYRLGINSLKIEEKIKNPKAGEIIEDLSGK